MINIGVIGLGMMGSTHLGVYGKREDVNVVAISDKSADLLHGRAKATGNIEGQAQGAGDLSSANRYDEGMDLIADEAVQVVDICLPTPLHLQYAEAALKAGKHVMVEKPLARTAADALKLAKAAEGAPGSAMVGMCMRFWPQWAWLKEAIDQGRYGPVRSAHFRRVAQHPGGRFYFDGDACGGALLDLHIHDTDFVHYCFGRPQAVFTRGYSKITTQPDHVLTQYLYDSPRGADGSAIISAEGGWAMADGFGFKMQYTVNFERATAMFDIGGVDGGEAQLVLIEGGNQPAPVQVPGGMGYEHEIAYFLDCIRDGRQPETVTVRDAAVSVQIAEAEKASIEAGGIAKVQY